MTVGEAEPAIAREAPALLDQLEQWLGALSRVVAIACVCGMLFVAAVIMVDVALRWIANEPVPAINEIVQMTFSVAIAACIPAGMMQRVNLKIDLVARYFSPRLHAWFEVLGGASLWLFYGALAVGIWIYAGAMAEDGKSTVILGLAEAPFMYAVSALFAFGVVLQAVIVLNDMRRAMAYGPGGMLGAAVTTAAVMGIAWLWIANIDAIASWAGSHVGLTLTLIFVVMWLLTLVLIPIAAIMGIVGVISSALFVGIWPSLSAASTEVTDFLGSPQLATLPLFLMMGSFAQVANVAEDIYRLAHVVLGRLRGGLGLATIAGCAGFGALTGHSVSTTVTVGKVALPEMQARGYSPAFSTGVCAAGGSLGALLPPASGVIILFALLSQASIGQLFVAAIGPGLLGFALYLVTIAIYVRVSPQSAPVRAADEAAQLWAALRRCGPAALLFGSVLGGVYFGFFTVTEAAAVGAFESFLCALWRGKLKGRNFWHVMAATTATTALIYGLIFGAQIFSFVVGVSRLTESATELMSHLDWTPTEIMTAILVTYLLLGAVMESFAVMVITVPIVTPLVQSLGYDILWWGIINICVVETGLIHPPLGLNVFVLKSIQPDVSIWTVYKGVAPFVVADLVKLALLVAFPGIALWLVSTMAQ
ncbi:MAG TPA: TRAP transporter large permease subunit [Stellaceae bacterium]|nr:TRAP transporter large permease subunit [Stellaceae bacterium]